MSKLMHFLNQKLFLLLIICCLGILNNCQALSEFARTKGFVYLHEIAPSIRISPRYFTAENFVGTRITGYNRPVIVLTRQAAGALSHVEDEVEKDGYTLVVYDAYRPQKAVNLFMHWSTDLGDQAKKSYYYPRVDKERVFELGYVAAKSGHSRGSTVDLTLIKTEKDLHEIHATKRTFQDGLVPFTFTFLDDGTVDMGSSFDLFDKASHYENDIIPKSFKSLRTYLKNVMEKNGFKNYAEEWWHFTLKKEPYPASDPSSYFDFDVE